MSEWQPIETAPKDGRPILAWCDHEADPYFVDGGDKLTPYGANAEHQHAGNGMYIVAWRDEIAWEDATSPAWWFVLDSFCDTAANPTHWMPLPAPPESD